MRSLSSTLIAAQQSPSAVPYVKLEAMDTIAGVTRLNFTRLYSGSEPDYFHSATMSADGSLIRARITPPSDARKLYYQRVAAPGGGSDFSQWIYSSQYNAVVVAAASLGAEVSIFWIRSDHRIQRIKSVDNGVSWGNPELIDYSVSSAINGICAAYKPNGDLAVFFADQATLYVKKCIGGTWQTKATWDKTTGDLSGASVVYDGDSNLFVTGKDTSGRATSSYGHLSMVMAALSHPAPGRSLKRSPRRPPRAVMNTATLRSAGPTSSAVFTWKNTAESRVIPSPSGRILRPGALSARVSGVKPCRSTCLATTAWL